MPTGEQTGRVLYCRSTAATTPVQVQGPPRAQPLGNGFLGPFPSWSVCKSLWRTSHPCASAWLCTHGCTTRTVLCFTAGLVLAPLSSDRSRSREKAAGPAGARQPRDGRTESDPEQLFLHLPLSGLSSSTSKRLRSPAAEPALPAPGAAIRWPPPAAFVFPGINPTCFPLRLLLPPSSGQAEAIPVSAQRRLRPSSEHRGCGSCSIPLCGLAPSRRSRSGTAASLCSRAPLQPGLTFSVLLSPVPAAAVAASGCLSFFSPGCCRPASSC